MNAVSNEKRRTSMAFYIRPTGTQISRGFKMHNVITCESKVQVVVSLGSYGLRKLGNICCGHKMFLNKIRNIFCVPDTKFVSATNVRARANGETFVSATMCPQQCVLVCQGL